MKEKDLNRIARLEQAIAKKYGQEAIQNPRRDWNDEKEEEYQEQLKKLDDIRGEQVEAGWGRQIRSYVMQPYQQVKDARTSIEVGNIQSVLDGDISIFIKEYLKWRRQGLND